MGVMGGMGVVMIGAMGTSVVGAMGASVVGAVGRGVVTAMGSGVVSGMVAALSSMMVGAVGAMAMRAVVIARNPSLPPVVVGAMSTGVVGGMMVTWHPSLPPVVVRAMGAGSVGAVVVAGVMGTKGVRVRVLEGASLPERPPPLHAMVGAMGDGAMVGAGHSPFPPMVVGAMGAGAMGAVNSMGVTTRPRTSHIRHRRPISRLEPLGLRASEGAVVWRDMLGARGVVLEGITLPERPFLHPLQPSLVHSSIMTPELPFVGVVVVMMTFPRMLF